MTLTRPAWSVTIASPGLWSYTITAGDPPFGGDLEFVPPLVAGFAFDADQLPAPVAPDSLQFRLFARNAAALPALIEGQLLTFELVRPTDTDPIGYMRTLLRITDLAATIDRLPAVYVDVTATDTLAALRATQIDATLPLQSRADRLAAIADAAGVRISHQLPTETAILAPLAIEQASAGDTAQVALNVDPWDVLRPAGTDDARAYQVQQLDPDAKLGTTLYEFYLDVDTVRLAERTDLPTADAYGALLQADWIDLSPTWRRGKESRPNKSIATGLENPADPQPLTATAVHRSLIAAYGESSRTIETQAWQTDTLATTARLALPQAADATSAWAVDELTVDTERLDDDELDAIAPMFVPHLDGSGSAAPPASVHVLGVPADLSLGQIAGRVTQARFTIEAGRLTIAPRILPGVPRAVDAVTYAGWRASVLAGATYADVDPAITYAQAKLARVATPPGFHPASDTFPSLALYPTED